MKGPSLVVSLHDVTSATWDRVRRQLTDLTSWGVSRMSFLTVPNYHGRERLDEDSRLGIELRKLQDKGHEMVLHGWSHQIHETSMERARGGTRIWFYENFYTSGEAEFLNFHHTEARIWMEKGIGLLEGMGLRPCGFIAPAWLMGPGAISAARDLGLLYTNTISRLIRVKDEQSWETRSCVWSTRARWRRNASLIWNRWLFNHLAESNPLRISLHPGDLEYPAVWKQIENMVKTALAVRKPVTYAEWINATL